MGLTAEEKRKNQERNLAWEFDEKIGKMAYCLGIACGTIHGNKEQFQAWCSIRGIDQEAVIRLEKAIEEISAGFYKEEQ